MATPPSLSTRSSIAAESETGEQLHVTGTYHSKSVSFKLSWQSTKPEGLQHHTLANHFIAGNTSSVSWPTVWPDSLLEFGPLWALFDPSSWLNQRWLTIIAGHRPTKHPLLFGRNSSWGSLDHAANSAP